MNDDRSYYLWLLRHFVESHHGRHDGYSCVLGQMYRKAYYYLDHVPFDENRAMDGMYLRDIYLDTEDPDGMVPDGPCSFLEFMIGVACKLSEMLADGEPIPPSEYFWELCDRLGLTEFTDDTYARASTTFMVDAVMTNYMDRTYCRSGEGGLFPLHPPFKDQRKVDVWYQLNTYLLQNPAFFETVR